jgi:NADPH:quinone reductase-like Zn-dependent oxidoreductase
VLPLGLSTAACGLFQKDYLALQYPSLSPKPAGKTLLVWGGSTSVGSNAIQLAVAAGYEVIATASPKNFDYCRRLGAIEVFDYRAPTAVAAVIKALEGRVCAGALAIGYGSVEACLDIVNASKGDKFVAIATPSVSFDDAPRGPSRALWLIPMLGRMLVASVTALLKSRMGRIRSKFIFGSTLVANEVGGLIYRDFLPQALAEGRYIAAPEPLVVGKGLDRLEAAMETLRRGVSARKVVVSV